MRITNRRQFLAETSAAIAISVAATASAAEKKVSRKLTIDLCCGPIGVKATQAKAIEYAAKYGFESVEANVGFLVKASAAELEATMAELASKRLVWGSAGMPVDFRTSDAKFRDGLAALPAAAAALRRAGGKRMSTWISPAHDELPYADNLRQHATRLKEVAKVLGDQGLRFGLEYVGPKTSWTARKYPFIHNMAQMKELIAAINEPNVGFVLDSWHWYTAHETAADLRTLKGSDVIAVDLNDAPTGRAIDEQIDSQRELPAATGVIDVATFLSTLVEIGCDAPVRAEPFNQPLRSMPAEQALAVTAAAMKKAFAQIK